jgi:hypothetical protein
MPMASSRNNRAHHEPERMKPNLAHVHPPPLQLRHKPAANKRPNTI